MKRALLVCLVVLGMAAPVRALDPNAPDRLFPVRASGQDVTVRIGNNYDYYHGFTAMQTEKDAMVAQRYNLAVQATAWAQTLPNCQFARYNAFTYLTSISTRFDSGPLYDDPLGPPRNIWAVNSGAGLHYGVELTIFAGLKACALSSSNAVACAATLPISVGDVLDIGIVNGKCVKGAPFALSPPAEPADPIGDKAGLITGKVVPILPRLTDRQLELLHATHAAHKAVSDWRCAGRIGAAPANVDGAHIDLEATAVNQDQRHLLTMKRFSGAVDPHWTVEQECKWARIQDKFHELWMQAVEAADWGRVRRNDTSHRFAHACMNLKDESGTWKLRFSCGDNVKLYDCPVMTCAEYLATQ